MLTNAQWPEHYRVWSNQVFGQILPVFIPDLIGVFSFPPGNKYHEAIWQKMDEVEQEIVDGYIKQIADLNIPGPITEFGIFRGQWINRFCDSLERQGIQREVWGFDSFQGIPAADPERDSKGWVEGAYAAPIDLVRDEVRADQRPNIVFVPGWYSESLLQEQARSLKQIAYARIDCDLYASAMDVLTYLSDRLSHGSFLVFDDWTHNADVGVTRAFAEWTKTVPNLEFEFLFFTGWGRFYIRCWHRGLSRARFEMISK